MMIKLLELKDIYLNNIQGATAVEYALFVAGISVALATVVFTFGDDLVALFGNSTLEQAAAN